jgi:hypothetical protein
MHPTRTRSPLAVRPRETFRSVLEGSPSRAVDDPAEW